MSKSAIAPTGIIGTLSDGRAYAVDHKAKARDLLRAQRQAGSKNQESVIYYLVADMVQLDGMPITFEDVMDMEIEDFSTLMAAVQGNHQGESNSQPDKAS